MTTYSPNNNLHIGDIAEHEFLLWALRKQYEVAKPINSQLRYDYLLYMGGAWHKIQVKSVSDRMNGKDYNYRRVIGAAASAGKRYTKEDIDFFFYAYNGIYWLIPVDKVSTTQIYLDKEGWNSYKV